MSKIQDIKDWYTMMTSSCQNYLHTHPEAMEYAEARFPRHVIDKWQIGFCPDVRDPFDGALKVERWQQRECGLLSEKGYLLIRGRLIFPIKDSKGNTIAFAARKINEDQFGGKYINSKNHSAYNKSVFIYGTQTFIEPWGESAVVVEGQTDVIALAEQGVRCVAASCGTSFTEGHLRYMKKLMPRLRRIVIMADADKAGKISAKRTAEIALREGIDPRIMQLKEGDPYDFANRWSRPGIRHSLEAEIRRAQKNWIVGLLDMKEYRQLPITERVEQLNEMIRMIKLCKPQMQQNLCINQLSQLTETDPVAIRDKVRQK